MANIYDSPYISIEGKGYFTPMSSIEIRSPCETAADVVKGQRPLVRYEHLQTCLQRLQNQNACYNDYYSFHRYFFYYLEYHVSYLKCEYHKIYVMIPTSE